MTTRIRKLVGQTIGLCGLPALDRRTAQTTKTDGLRHLLRAAFCAAIALSAAFGADAEVKSTAMLPPRKVIVGTTMKAFWGEYPPLETRLAQLTTLVDRMAADAKKKYGRGIDLAILPEVAVTGEIPRGKDVVDGSVPLAGPVQDAFSRKARELRTYIVVPTYLLEDRAKRLCTNAAILFGRKGEVVGIYRKLHPAVVTGSDSFEGGIAPGKTAPVFECDFGRLGIQICFDIEFDSGWRELARQNADLVAWPTQSPQTAQPAFRAKGGRYYVVSSTWRHNASIFEPTGRIVAQIKAPDDILVSELDLSYAILPWSPKLQKGEGLRKLYGDRIGFRYYEDEDRGIFWSNDPKIPVAEMYRMLGLAEVEAERRRVRQLFDKAGVPVW
jgi:predicted amidohydrolase